MTTKNFKSTLFFALGCGILFTSCSKDNEEDNISGNLTPNSAVAQVNLTAKATYTSSFGKGLTLKTTNANLEITDFLVNIREIELEFDDDSWKGKKSYGSDDDITLKGPFELDLLNEEVVLALLNLPQLGYKEIEFEFDKNNNSSSELFRKTVLVKGFIDGFPFEFWHDFDEDLELEFDDYKGKRFDKEDTLTIFFDLNGIFSGIDFSRVKDGNQDGIIEINPRDLDGNQNIARQIKERIKDYIDLIED